MWLSPLKKTVFPLFYHWAQFLSVTQEWIVSDKVVDEGLLYGNIKIVYNKNRTSRLGVPSAILNGRSPLPGQPSCRLRPHSGRPGRGERSLSVAEGTPLPCGSIIGHRPIPLGGERHQYYKARCYGTMVSCLDTVTRWGRTGQISSW